jgi:hypothetical protein
MKDCGKALNYKSGFSKDNFLSEFRRFQNLIHILPIESGRGL